MTFALARRWAPLGLAALAIACQHDTAGSGPDLTVHCGDNGGDAACISAFPNKPYCDLCQEKEDDQGCRSTPPPPGCVLGGTSGNDGGGTSSSTGSNEVTSIAPESSTSVAIDESSGGTTAAGPCDHEGEIDQDCQAFDPMRPYCIAAVCSGCVDAGGDAFCRALDPTTPACDPSTTVCLGCEQAGAGFCTDTTPVCSGTGACEACDFHDDCPDSACHISPEDPLQGSCFATDEVVWVDGTAICPGMGTMNSPSCSLGATVSAVGPGGNAVVFVLPGTYDEHVVASQATIAIIGQGGTPVVSGLAGLVSASLEVQGALVYLDGMRMAGNNVSHGISCAGGTLWLDGSEARENSDYGIYVTSPCTVTLRRAGVHNNQGGGIRQLGGTLVLDNAVIGQNGDGAHGPGLNVEFADVTAIYSTIAGNDGVGNDSIQCIDATGTVRNSIVVGQAATSIDLDCFTFDFATNAVDTSSFTGDGGVLVGAYDSSWFNDPDGGDFRLMNAPFTPFGDVALWVDGDPTLDADGTPRPQGGALGYAGVDEP